MNGEMSLSEPFDDRLMADLAAAADGTLPPTRQAELEAMAEEDSELAAALDEQRRAVTLIRGAAAEIHAPLALRERLENERVRAARPARPRRRWFSIALGGAALAAVLLAVVLAAPGSPTVDEAAAFALQPATGPAPAAQGALLDAEQSGVAFPNWAEKFGWKATGSHTGKVGGRDATTVYYEKEGKTLAYTIVSGDSLGDPDDATTIEVEGTGIDLFDAEGGNRAAEWLRDGHTCILAGKGVDDATMAKLAGWKAKGDVAF
jgi:hypothetical protein